MKILFTGATSLAGGEWFRQLCHDGHDVIAVSRRALPAHRVVCADLSLEGAEAGLPDQRFDALIHFASYVPANETASTWEECAPTNIHGVVRVLRWAEGRVNRIILASSCAIYGAQKLYTPTDELHPLRPDTNYALTKYAQEQIVSAFCISRNIPLVIMRLGYVYGPGMLEGRAIIKLLHLAQASEPITLTNASSAGLHLIHTRDIAHIGNHLLHQSAGVYNVVTGRHISLLDYVETAMKVTSSSSKLTLQNDPEASVTNWYSIAKLLHAGVRPTVALEDGIASLLGQEEATRWNV